jgi:hypothetical protein
MPFFYAIIVYEQKLKREGKKTQTTIRHSVTFQKKKSCFFALNNGGRLFGWLDG